MIKISKSLCIMSHNSSGIPLFDFFSMVLSCNFSNFWKIIEFFSCSFQVFLCKTYYTFAQMTSQDVDIFSMLNKAQNDYNLQQSSVAAFFQQASNGGRHNKGDPLLRSVPMPIKSLNSLEQIERQIRTSPPSNRKLLFILQPSMLLNTRIF